ncbi:MAG: carbohydrate kinase family protein [Lachnospiraceae bacterium]
MGFEIRQRTGAVLSIGMAVADLIAGPVTRDLFDRDSIPVQLSTHPGGDAVNVCLNAAALGLKAHLCSAVGKDPNGTLLLSALQDAGVDTSNVRILSDTATAACIVVTEPSGERHFLTCQDCFSRITPAGISDELLEKVGFVSLNSYYRMPLVDGAPATDLFHRAREHGACTVLDTMICRRGNAMDQIREVLQETDLFLPSYEEAKQITGASDPRKMAEILSGTGIRAFAVKLGDKGSFVTDFEKEKYLPADETTQVVGTVGCGDTYCAGMMAALSKGEDLFASAAFATCAAACTAEVTGANGGIRSFAQVDARRRAYLERHF